MPVHLGGRQEAPQPQLRILTKLGGDLGKRSDSPCKKPVRIHTGAAKARKMARNPIMAAER